MQDISSKFHNLLFQSSKFRFSPLDFIYSQLRYLLVAVVLYNKTMPFLSSI